MHVVFAEIFTDCNCPIMNINTMSFMADRLITDRLSVALNS